MNNDNNGTDHMSAGGAIEEMQRALRFMAQLASVVDDFHEERSRGALTLISDGVNVMATRADDAETALVAASRIRRALASYEHLTHQIIDAHQTRRSEAEESFFSEEEEAV